MTTKPAPAREDAATGLSQDLVDWMADAVQGRIVSVDRRPGGGRREAWFVDAEKADGTRLELFLRYDRSDPDETGDPFTLQDEARYFLALQDTAVPVPRIHAVHPEEQAILANRVPGQAWFSRLRDEEQRVSLAKEFMGILAALHAVDPAKVLPPGRPPETDLVKAVHAELDRWEALYRRADGPADPLIELGLAWVRQNVPDVQEPPVIVQGDTGPGNFLYADGRVTAVLDWELAHLGDPHDDLAWVSVRAVQEPFTHFPDRLADYAAAAGRTVDLDRIRYYRVLAELRILILGHAGPRDPLSEVGNGMIYGMLHRRLFVEALADVTGARLAPPEPLPSVEGENEWLYEVALTQLAKIIVPRSEDPFVVLRSKGLARILKYLRENERLGDARRRAELDDLEALLGARPDTPADGLARLADGLREGAVPLSDALPVLYRRVLRETQVWRPAMGVLADRHFDPLS